MRRPLIIVFPAYCMGILAAGYLSLPIWLYFLWGITAICLASWAIYRKWLLAPHLILLSVILAGLIRMSAVSALSDHFIANYIQESPVRVEGVINEVMGSWMEGQGKIRIVYVLDVQQVADHNGQHKADGKIRLTVRQAQENAHWRIGDRISVSGKLRLPKPGSNPGDLDYRAYFLRQGIGAVMNSTCQDAAVVGNTAWYQPLRWMHQLRENISGIMTMHMGETEAAMLKGLVFGERAAIPAQVEWDFADTGLVHILSVSGFHVALIAGVMFGLLRLMNCSEVFCIKVTMFCIGCYVLLVGFSPPVLRSAIMAIVLMGATLLLRKKDAMQALLVAGWLLLLWDPRQIFDIGFQLSFGATAGLIMLSPVMTERFTKYVPCWVAAVISATIAATLAVLPMLANYFQQFSIISLLANVLLTYPVSLLIILGLLAAIFGSIWAPLAYTITMLSNWLTNFVIQMANFLANIPFAAVHIVIFPWWLVIIYYMFLGWVFQLYTPFLLPSFTNVWREPCKRMMFLAVCWMFVLFCYWSTGREEELVVTFLNVGQGDATLICTPHGRRILIDGGGGLQADGTGYDTGEKIIIPFLRREGIRALDVVILSHGHEDHAGGLRSVLRYMQVGELLTLTDQFTTQQISELLNICRAQHIPVRKPDKGQQLVIDGINIEILTPSDFTERYHDVNETSIILRVTYGEHQFLFTGDLEGEAEQKLLQGEDKLASTVLKVGHHGSGRGTSSAFLAKVNPVFAVISVGERNAYGHPDQAVLHRLQACNVQVYRTDQDGAISFRSDGRHLNVQTYMRK